MIDVKRKNNQEFLVVVDDGGPKTEHTVTLDDGYYQDLTRGTITKEELIKKSFEFLLTKEPKEFILSEFNLKIIGKFFPEFEEKIKI